MNPWRSLHGFIESMELPCPKLRRSSWRRGKARRRSKIVGEQIEEPDRRTMKLVLQSMKNPSSIEDLCKFVFCYVLGGDPISTKNNLKFFFFSKQQKEKKN
ncbi:hypothetical protein ACOSP7_020257 [Xanthoceras sorbifolium]